MINRFTRKVLERQVLSQIDEHLSKNNLKEKCQSAYRAKYSTETALLKVTSDILNGLDNRNVSMQALLDLSAAFDTIDHDILLSRLKTTFGIDGLVLKWAEMYLSSRQQKVKIKSNISSSKVFKFGVS